MLFISKFHIFNLYGVAAQSNPVDELCFHLRILLLRNSCSAIDCFPWVSHAVHSCNHAYLAHIDLEYHCTTGV